MHSYFKLTAAILIFLVSISACKEKKNPAKQAPEKIIYKIDTAKEKSLPKNVRAPIINITDSIAPREIVLYVKDTAKTSERIGMKLEHIYSKILPEFFKKNNITKTGPRIAWFKSSSAPFYFEAGFPVNKKPKKTPKNILVREIGGDSALIAHFYGPYHLTYEAYEVLRQQLKDSHKKPSSPPYEKYIIPLMDSTGKARDPYKVLTDIIFPYR